MRILFLSDIHSNWYYLEQISDVIREENYDLLYFLGDAIGYYDQPNEVLDWLKSMNAICIKGNHEQYFLNELPFDPKLSDIYQVETNKKTITYQNKEFIRSWKDTIETTIKGKKFLIMHGDVDSSEVRTYNSNEIDTNILKKYDFYVYGHTHLPLIHYSYGCCIVNPGSIGQPRDFTNLASYAIVDLNTNETSLKKIHTDNKVYLEKLARNKFDMKVIQALTKDRNGSN